MKGFVFKLIILSLMTMSFNSMAKVELGGSSLSPCEVSFVKLLNGKLPAEARGNAALNMWDERFNPELLAHDLKLMGTKEKQLEFLDNLAKLVSKDPDFVENVANVATMMMKKRMVTLTDINKLFVNRGFEHASFYYSKTSKEVIGRLNIDPAKRSFVSDIINTQELSKNMRKEYENILVHSNRTTEELDFAIKNGMKLRNDAKSMEQFREYMEFLDLKKAKQVRSGLKDIEKIYDFNYKPGKLELDLLNPEYKKFLNQKAKLESFEQKRLKEIEDNFKMQMDDDIIKELNDIKAREKMGLSVDKRRKLGLEEKIEEIKLNKGLQKRALQQAKGEKRIYKRLMNGCSSGDSKRLESAKKKFAKFKLALAIGGTPLFYWMKNKDKMDTDQYWFERLGYEWSVGLIFTFVGNKIVTNSDSGFWRKYLEGYVKFGALDAASAAGYDVLFGEKSYIRYFKQIYAGKDIPAGSSELEQEFEKLKSSPHFEEDIKSLMAYLDSHASDKNVKNFLDQHLNLGAYASLEDDRITQEDLETEEGREMMMELLAERMYLENMGEWPIFQTGSAGLDRWSFYRMRNIVWDMKGLALNLAVFQIMCREPLGKVGSWGLILGLVLGDQFFSGDITYGLRREAINQ